MSLPAGAHVRPQRTIEASPVASSRDVPSARAKPGLLVVGNHLSRAGRGRTVSEDLAIRLEALGFPVITTSAKRSRALRAADMLLTTVRSRGRYQVALIDVFSGRAFRYAEAISHAVARLGRPLVLALHGGDLPRFADRFPKRIETLFGRAHAIVCPSPYLASQLEKFADIRIIPNPVDCSRFQCSTSRTGDLPPRKVIWLRAFHEIYRPWDAVSAVARVHASRPTIELKMIGPDKGDGSLEKVRAEIRATSSSPHVELVSSAIAHDSVPAALASGDIFLNTTAVDNSPVSVLEAMASGLPVVSTNAGGLPHLLQHEHTALMTDVGDIDQQAAALCRLLDDASLYSRLRNNGRRGAEQHDWSKVLPQWCALIERVASGPT